MRVLGLLLASPASESRRVFAPLLSGFAAGVAANAFLLLLLARQGPGSEPGRHAGQPGTGTATELTSQKTGTRTTLTRTQHPASRTLRVPDSEQLLLGPEGDARPGSVERHVEPPQPSTWRGAATGAGGPSPSAGGRLMAEHSALSGMLEAAAVSGDGTVFHSVSGIGASCAKEAEPFSPVMTRCLESAELYDRLLALLLAGQQCCESRAACSRKTTKRHLAGCPFRPGPRKALAALLQRAEAECGLARQNLERKSLMRIRRKQVRDGCAASLEGFKGKGRNRKLVRDGCGFVEGGEELGSMDDVETAGYELAYDGWSTTVTGSAGTPGVGPAQRGAHLRFSWPAWLQGGPGPKAREAGPTKPFLASSDYDIEALAGNSSVSPATKLLPVEPGQGMPAALRTGKLPRKGPRLDDACNGCKGCGEQEELKVSYMLQYYKQPDVVEKVVESYASCVPGVPGNKSSDPESLKVELMANVDQPGESKTWTKLWMKLNSGGDQSPSERSDLGFLVVVFSHNKHEVRGYNRLVRMSRAGIVLMTQDDDLSPSNCHWIARLAALFDSRERVDGVGYNTAVKVEGSAIMRMGTQQFEVDKVTGVRSLFTQWVDIGPMLIRRQAWLEMGGLDEAMGHPGQSGIFSDWHMSQRIWMAGGRLMAAHGTLHEGLLSGGAGVTGSTRQYLTVSNAWREMNTHMNGGLHGRTLAAANQQVMAEVKRNSVFHTIEFPMFIP